MESKIWKQSSSSKTNTLNRWASHLATSSKYWRKSRTFAVKRACPCRSPDREREETESTPRAAKLPLIQKLRIPQVNWRAAPTPPESNQKFNPSKPVHLWKTGSTTRRSRTQSSLRLWPSGVPQQNQKVNKSSKMMEHNQQWRRLRLESQKTSKGIQKFTLKRMLMPYNPLNHHPKKRKYRRSSHAGIATSFILKTTSPTNSKWQKKLSARNCVIIYTINHIAKSAPSLHVKRYS